MPQSTLQHVGQETFVIPRSSLRWKGVLSVVSVHAPAADAVDHTDIALSFLGMGLPADKQGDLDSGSIPGAFNLALVEPLGCI